ncbi:hypothetical protein FVE85_5393 [Porphyridium purpureum]|uniref:NADH dehydrogenase [ubiquinone] 1 alpha subcomplex subunit 7 n=1 Tax=Porphyridium purpureum TaxID=35688 RepID=A0A5J4Z3H8_PORPP|nr:hypothetical protein FVE85_5393 [Porphyridium purpureum]|eukprot:POR5320..scf295_1
MALRPTRMLLSGAQSGANAGGLRGLIERMKTILTTGKILRQDLAEDTLRRPFQETHYRYPSPASQPKVQIPQGEYRKVFDINYSVRDSRRRITRETVEPYRTVSDLPPTPGKVWHMGALGYAGEFDKIKD